MARQPPPRPVENYTGPFLAMTGLILFVGFWTLAALAGPIWVLVTALGLDRAIAMLPRRRRDRPHRR